MRNMTLPQLQLLRNYLRDPNCARIARMHGTTRQAVHKRVNKHLKKVFGATGRTWDDREEIIDNHREELIDFVTHQIDHFGE